MPLGKQTAALKHSPFKDPITICQHEMKTLPNNILQNTLTKRTIQVKSCSNNTTHWTSQEIFKSLYTVQNKTKNKREIQTLTKLVSRDCDF